MTHDLLIKNGTIVDGTGAAQFRGDIAVSGGRITGVGKVDGGAAEVIDADGLIVAPGFVDPHTHYDAQISWDPLLNASSEHGVTTVVMGNCGVGVAPCRPTDHDLLIEDLINVEGMSQSVLAEGIRWNWESFGDYLEMAKGQQSAVNRAFMVPLSPLRTYVMGSDAGTRGATADETTQMAKHIEAAMAAGASGFSTSNNRSQIGYQGKPFAARLTSRDEYAAYCGVLKRAGRGVIQIAVTNRFATLADDEYELLDFLLTHSGRPVTWISLLNDPNKPNGCREVLDKVDPLIKRGCAAADAHTLDAARVHAEDPLRVHRVQVSGTRVQPPGRGAEKSLRGPGIPRGVQSGARRGPALHRPAAQSNYLQDGQPGAAPL